jgi:hypothetical protein
MYDEFGNYIGPDLDDGSEDKSDDGRILCSHRKCESNLCFNSQMAGQAMM